MTIETFGEACRLLWIDAVLENEQEIEVGYIGGAFAISKEDAAKSLNLYMSVNPGRLAPGTEANVYEKIEGSEALWDNNAHSHIFELLSYTDWLLWQNGARLKHPTFIRNFLTKCMFPRGAS